MMNNTEYSECAPTEAFVSETAASKTERILQVYLSKCRCHIASASLLFTVSALNLHLLPDVGPNCIQPILEVLTVSIATAELRIRPMLSFRELDREI